MLLSLPDAFLLRVFERDVDEWLEALANQGRVSDDKNFGAEEPGCDQYRRWLNMLRMSPASHFFLPQICCQANSLSLVFYHPG